jgi:hypothetical protein
MDDDDIFGSVPSNPGPAPEVSAPASSTPDLMGGFSFEPSPSPPPSQPPASNDPFGMMGLDIGSNQAQPPQSNQGGFGGDLLGFG